ncbi:MAG TPA: aspartate/glutamate racemase family protein [Pseudolabrys sp.]|nr:aspartate/glutamate racemase family protein [Pseudolabrys sp.]
MPAGPRIALIHATPVAMAPIEAALSSGWPEAKPVNILEDSLSPDRALSEELTPELFERISDLAHYARRSGADGILFTCSAFGAAIERAAAALDVPVLKPNEAMFEEAIKAGRNNAMIATFAPARAGMEAEFAEEAARLDPRARLTSFVVEPAMTALRAGDAATHNTLVAKQAASLKGYDAIVLAHFSTARAAAAVREVIDVPVLTSPDAAVRKLRRLVANA